MQFTLFLGCNIPARVQQYERSARAVLDKLGIQVVDNSEFKCCGNPIRNTDDHTSLLMAARNLALAGKQNMEMMVLCKCCFGALKKADHVLAHNPLLQDKVNSVLAREQLHYTGAVKIKHFLSVLYHEIGINALQKNITRPYKELNIATHYGCHALRPSDVMQFDNPVAPVLFDELVSVTGAKSVKWPLQLECCGAPILGVMDTLSMDLTERKINDGLKAGADFLCVACPYCHMQFDRVQKMMASGLKERRHLASIVYPQLLGLGMGIDVEELGLSENELDISTIESYVDQE